jgi:hypothetical protein
MKRISLEYVREHSCQGPIFKEWLSNDPNPNRRSMTVEEFVERGLAEEYSTVCIDRFLDWCLDHKLITIGTMQIKDRSEEWHRLNNTYGYVGTMSKYIGEYAPIPFISQAGKPGYELFGWMWSTNVLDIDLHYPVVL